VFRVELIDKAIALLAAFREQGLKLATAESCTGGLIAALITEISGSSDVYERGFVTYSNEAKTELIGVDAGLIALHGAVSAEVARAMAEGSLRFSRCDIAVAVTGIAGPGGGSMSKPVGLVHLATARRGGVTVDQACRFGDIGRQSVRLAAVDVALDMLLDALA
jgi:nicotinamide-nucleotide amidase